MEIESLSNISNVLAVPDNSSDEFIHFEIPPDCQSSQISVIYLFTYLTDEALSVLFYATFEKILITAVFPIVFITGFIGNVAFLLVLGLFKEMRTTTNIYLGNLAVADLLFIVLTATSYYASYISSFGLVSTKFYRTSFGCGCLFSMIYLSYFASICLMTLVGFERYLAICFPLKHRMVSSTKRTLVLVVSTWMVSMGFAALVAPSSGRLTKKCVIWPERERYEDLPNVLHSCAAVHPIFNDIFGIAQAIPFTAALIINTVFYVMIIHRLNARGQNGGDAGKSRINRINKVRNQVARMLIINGVIFFFCLAPFQFLNLLSVIIRHGGKSILTSQQHSSLLWGSRCTSILNSAINPFVYSATNPRYRKAFLEFFRCAICKPVRKGTTTPIFSVTDTKAQEESQI